MVEINNRRQAFDMLAWSEGTDNGRQKTRTAVMTSLYELFTDYSDHPRKLVTLNPKLKSTGADATSFFPVGGAYRKQLKPERLLSEKSGRQYCSRLRSAALYL